MNAPPVFSGLSVIELAVKIELSGVVSTLTMLRTALVRVSESTEKDENERSRAFSGTLHWMLGGLYSFYSKPLGDHD